MKLEGVGGLGGQEAAVHERFAAFVRRHNLNSAQLRFPDLLQNHSARYGAIDVARLYDPPQEVMTCLRSLDTDVSRDMDDLEALLK